MGFIILGQVEFLKFDPVDQISSVGACFISALIYLIIVIAILVYERCSFKKVTSQENYYDLST
jgi:hypothetical protein